MDIYLILSKKEHKHHKLIRYIKFIHNCKVKNENFQNITENHHICPKAKDMFPEYKSFKENPWNLAKLTPRQHYIAHTLLWKAFPTIKSTAHAVWYMSNSKWAKFNSKIYENIKNEFINIKSNHMVILNKERVKNGTHHFLDGNKNGHSLTMSRIIDGSHNWLGGKYQREFQLKRSNEGTHHWLGNNNPVHRQITEGTHHFLSSEYQSNLQKKRIKEGTHHMLGGMIQKETQRRIVASGKHHFSKKIPCIDKNGMRHMIDNELFYSQIGDKEHHEYVSFNSKEGKRRVLECSLK